MLMYVTLSALPKFYLSGSAYIFSWNGSGWSQTTKLLSTDGAKNNYISTSISTSSEMLVIGDVDDEKYSSSAYVIDWNGIESFQSGKLVALECSQCD